MTARLGSSASSSLLWARRQSSCQGTSAFFFLHPYPATLGGGASRQGGAAETAGPPPPRWAMSNQLRGQGALWTERDKRPCVRGGLLIYRPLHPPSERTPRSPVLGGGSSQRPAAARPLAAGSAAWALKGSRLTSSLRGPTPATGSRLTWVLRSPAPSSGQPGHPRLAGTADLAGALLQPGPKSQECTRDSSVAAGGPAPRPPRAPPLLDQLYPDSGLAGDNPAPRPPWAPPFLDQLYQDNHYAAGSTVSAHLDISPQTQQSRRPIWVSPIQGPRPSLLRVLSDSASFRRTQTRLPSSSSY